MLKALHAHKSKKAAREKAEAAGVLTLAKNGSAVLREDACKRFLDGIREKNQGAYLPTA